MQYIEPVGALGPANAFGHDYVDKNAGAGIAGSYVAADAIEHPQIEILNAQAAAGLTPAGNLTQLAQAISTGINLGTAGGTANALTATIPGSVVFPSLQAGMRFTVKFGAAANSGPATLDLTGFASDPPAIAIVRNDNGAALEGGELIGWGQLLFDGVVFRLMAVPRLRTPRVIVPAGGVTITARDEYTTFVMDLGIRQVQALPAPNSVPVGFSCIFEVTGQPSGFQTAYLTVTGGGNLFYRGDGSANFYLIGGGEVFELVSTGVLWLVRLVSQPANIGVYRTAVGQPATVAVGSTFGNVNVDTVSGAPSVFSLTSATIRLPVSGVYNITAGIAGYNNTSAWDNLDVCVFDNTSGLVTQDVKSLPIFNSFTARPKSTFTQAYPAGTSLLIAARAAGGQGVINGNASEFSAFLTGR